MMRWIVSWTVFGLGHLVSLVMDRCDRCGLYPIYSWLMHESVLIQGDGPGPWKSGKSAISTKSRAKAAE